MVTYNKFEAFVEHLMNKAVDLFGSPIGDSLKITLHSVAPVATNSLLADLTQIAAGNGYTTDGTAVPDINATRTGGVVTLTGDALVFTGGPAAMASFRYYAMHDTTAASDPLIAWWDHGSAVVLNNGDTFTINFNNDATDGTIFTIS
jgi:hypothetical protein